MATLQPPKGLLHSLPLTLSVRTEKTSDCVQLRSIGSFRPSAGRRHLHRHYISLSSWLRQRPTRCTIRAGRNLPDKEFRYLRTVIVTADIHQDLGLELRTEVLTPHRNLLALVTCHILYFHLRVRRMLVFLLNSRLAIHLRPRKLGTPSSEVTGLDCRVP